MVMVAQFTVELRSLRAADGNDFTTIIHLNPWLCSDWRHKPVLEMDTCCMQLGQDAALRRHPLHGR